MIRGATPGFRNIELERGKGGGGKPNEMSCAVFASFILFDCLKKKKCFNEMLASTMIAVTVSPAWRQQLVARAKSFMLKFCSKLFVGLFLS